MSYPTIETGAVSLYIWLHRLYYYIGTIVTSIWLSVEESSIEERPKRAATVIIIIINTIVIGK